MKRQENKFFVGEVTESLPNTMFRVSLEDGRVVLATMKGRVRRSSARIMPGVKVRVEMTPYDDKRGRIVGTVRKRGE